MASKRIGDHEVASHRFAQLDQLFQKFQKKEFQKQPAKKRFQAVNEELLSLIDKEPLESFLLPSVIDYIDRVNKGHVLHERYHISLFEFWMNHFSGLPEEKSYEIRAKIAGRYVPRDDYQALFPIGMSKVFNGSHFVAAHLSPDVDTMVASFWGWVDAFAACVSSAQHLWSLPGGAPVSPITRNFLNFFGDSIFANAAHTSASLTLKALDLITQKGFVKKTGKTSISTLEINASDRGVVLVDEEGCFLGDWHSSDVDPIRKIVIRFKSCLRWFETNLHVKLISLFAKEKLHVNDLAPFLASIFEVPISMCEPVKEFTERQRKDLNDFFLKVLNLDKGLEGSFGDLSNALAKLSVLDLSGFKKELESLPSSDLFDASGYLKENRPAIFNKLEKIIEQLDNAIHRIRDYAEQLDVAMNIKSKVMGYLPQYTLLRNDVDDMRIKMKKWEFLTVVASGDDDKLFPVGVVWAHDLNKSTLGTVSFRDFCNQEEVRMASYLSPISVIDHHKTSLKTASAPLAIISDAQSCNVLLAEQSFKINAPYSLGGATADSIHEQMQALAKTTHTPSSRRLMQRLIQRQIAAASRQKYFVHPDRELSEYFCYLYAILDDTDLLTKMSKRDIECVVQLLNRVKSIISKQEVEVINLDDIPSDQNFCKVAAKRILKNPEMYSIYQKLYETREREIEECLHNPGEWHHLFLDTKEQNSCCRVGQTKLFSDNFSSYHKITGNLRKYWLKKAQTVNHAHPEIDLHIHMVSTIPSGAEVYEDRPAAYPHQDELWFWTPNTQKAFDHLSSFLTAFVPGQKMTSDIRIEFIGSIPEDAMQIFHREFGAIPQSCAAQETDLPISVLYYPAGILNSRKAMITPYLPRLVQ